MDGQDRGADLGGEAGAAVDAGARLLVQPVDADERAARPRDGRLGGNGDAEARRDADRLLDGPVARDMLPGKAELEPAPVAAVEAVGDLLALRRGFEERYGASRHRQE